MKRRSLLAVALLLPFYFSTLARERQLQDRAEANLPQIVLAIHNDKKLQKATDAPSVMRLIRDFYEGNSIPIPSEISGILSEVSHDH
jgi:hypothetical protein